MANPFSLFWPGDATKEPDDGGVDFTSSVRPSLLPAPLGSWPGLEVESQSSSFCFSTPREFVSPRSVSRSSLTSHRSPRWFGTSVTGSERKGKLKRPSFNQQLEALTAIVDDRICSGLAAIRSLVTCLEDRVTALLEAEKQMREGQISQLSLQLKFFSDLVDLNDVGSPRSTKDSDDMGSARTTFNHLADMSRAIALEASLDTSKVFTEHGCTPTTEPHLVVPATQRHPLGALGTSLREVRRAKGSNAFLSSLNTSRSAGHLSRGSLDAVGVRSGIRQVKESNVE